MSEPNRDAQSRPHVVLDPALRGLMPRYFENLHRDLDHVRLALDRDDPEDARRVLHGVKGAAQGFGLAGLGAMAADAGSAVRAGALGEALALVAAMGIYADTVQVDFEDE